MYSIPLQGRLSTWTQESDNFSAHPIIGVQQRVARQQQQYLDKHPEEGKEARFPLGRESKSLGKNMPQWLKDHTWKAASPGSGSTRAHLPPRKQRGAWGHPPTHTALKFYTEGHHVGAKRFYGYTFGLHIGVLGGGVGGGGNLLQKGFSQFLGRAAHLVAATNPRPLCLGLPEAIPQALHSSK